jgi:hypothetical protein
MRAAPPRVAARPASSSARVMTNSHWSKAGYHRILSAQALSALGDRVSYVVVPLALLNIGFHVGMVASILGARAIAYGVVVLWGGVLADRISCVRLMVTSDAVRFFTQLATGGLVFFHVKIVALFILAQIMFGFAEACFKPAAGRLLPEVVPDIHLERANGYYNSAVNFGMVFGPILGGFLVAAGDSAIGLVIDATTFLFSAVILFGIRSSTKAGNSHRTSSPLQQLIEPTVRTRLRTALRRHPDVAILQRYRIGILQRRLRHRNTTSRAPRNARPGWIIRRNPYQRTDAPRIPAPRLRRDHHRTSEYDAPHQHHGNAVLRTASTDTKHPQYAWRHPTISRSDDVNHYEPDRPSKVAMALTAFDPTDEIGGRPFSWTSRLLPEPRHNLGVKSSEVIVVILVTSHRVWSRFTTSR